MRRLKALGATLVLLILVVGIPLGMAATIGNPLHGWADLKVGDLTDEVIIDLLAVIVWLAWAQFAVSVLVEFGAAVRHVQRPTRIPLVPGSSQHLSPHFGRRGLLLEYRHRDDGQSGARAGGNIGPARGRGGNGARPEPSHCSSDRRHTAGQGTERPSDAGRDTGTDSASHPE